MFIRIVLMTFSYSIILGFFFISFTG